MNSLTGSGTPAQLPTDFTRARSHPPASPSRPHLAADRQVSLTTTSPGPGFPPNGNAKLTRGPRRSPTPQVTPLPAVVTGPAKRLNAARSCRAGAEGQPALSHLPPAPRVSPLVPQFYTATNRRTNRCAVGGK